jgi:hypothetical protein
MHARYTHRIDSVHLRIELTLPPLRNNQSVGLVLPAAKETAHLDAIFRWDARQSAWDGNVVGWVIAACCGIG